jgi:hypothetical protein
MANILGFEDGRHMIQETLDKWKRDLPNRINVRDLLSQNPIAHKYKAPYTALLIRSLVFWRLYDLLRQAHMLAGEGMVLGSRILLRSAIETLCMLIFLNRKMENLVSGKGNFDQFSNSLTKLLLGTRDDLSVHEPINIMTLIDQSDKKYEGIRSVYDHLSEGAHPNLDGMGLAYGKTRVDPNDGLVFTLFGDFWVQMFPDAHVSGIEFCIVLFENEYHEVWG